MTISIANRVRFFSSAVGTGRYPINGADTGYLTPAQAGLGVGMTSTWLAQTADRSTWELFVGTIAADGYVSRNSIVLSNTGGAIAWPSGSVQIISQVIHAQSLPYLQENGAIPAKQVPLLNAVDNASWAGEQPLGSALYEFFNVPIPATAIGFTCSVFSHGQVTGAGFGVISINARVLRASNVLSSNQTARAGTNFSTGPYLNPSGSYTEMWPAPLSPVGWQINFGARGEGVASVLRELVANVNFYVR